MARNGERCLCGTAYPGAVRQGFTHTSGACYRTPGHHFNYEIQAWILRGRVKACAHPTEMRTGGKTCCNAFAYQGMTESAAVAAQKSDRNPQPEGVPSPAKLAAERAAWNTPNN